MSCDLDAQRNPWSVKDRCGWQRRRLQNPAGQLPDWPDLNSSKHHPDLDNRFPDGNREQLEGAHSQESGLTPSGGDPNVRQLEPDRHLSP